MRLADTRRSKEQNIRSFFKPLKLGRLVDSATIQRRDNSEIAVFKPGNLASFMWSSMRFS